MIFRPYFSGIFVDELYCYLTVILSDFMSEKVKRMDLKLRFVTHIIINSKDFNQFNFKFVNGHLIINEKHFSSRLPHLNEGFS